MFEIPNAKRVRRDELYGPTSDAGSNGRDAAEEDVELRAKLNERLSRLLGLDLSGPEPAAAAATTTAHEAGLDAPQGRRRHEEEFEFRLFSTTSRTAAPARVVLTASDDEDAEQAEGAFLVPSRPATYYVAGEPTPEQREGYRHAAVTAEDIAAGAGRRAWGLEKPWRVVRITVSPGRPPKGPDSAVTATAAGDQGGEGARRKRPGRKRRIALRIKTKAEKAQVDRNMSKEEHLKEKKKRLNREKKLKRRAREKEQRLAARGQEGAQAVADSDTDDSAA